MLGDATDAEERVAASRQEDRVWRNQDERSVRLIGEA
jgi:hypothetical protein